MTSMGLTYLCELLVEQLHQRGLVSRHKQFIHVPEEEVARGPEVAVHAVVDGAELTGVVEICLLQVDVPGVDFSVSFFL